MTKQPFLYPLPSFLKGTVTHPAYDDWLDNKARGLHYRDGGLKIY